MESDDHRQPLNSSPPDLSLKRKTPDDGLSSLNQPQQESTSPSSFNSATPGVWGMEASTVIPSSISEVLNAKGLQSSGGTMQYHIEDEDEEEHERRLGADYVSYEVIILEIWKFSYSTTVPPVDAEACCICQEEYAGQDGVGKLEC